MITQVVDISISMDNNVHNETETFRIKFLIFDVISEKRFSCFEKNYLE